MELLFSRFLYRSIPYYGRNVSIACGWRNYNGGHRGGRGLAPEGSKIHSIVIEKIKTISKKQ
jgi:hypothetical protein